MRTSGIFMVLAGIVIIAFYIIYELLKVIVFLIPNNMRIALALILVGGLLVLASVIKERVSDSKGEFFKGIKSWF